MFNSQKASQLFTTKCLTNCLLLQDIQGPVPVHIHLHVCGPCAGASAYACGISAHPGATTPMASPHPMPGAVKPGPLVQHRHVNQCVGTEPKQGPLVPMAVPSHVLYPLHSRQYFPGEKICVFSLLFDFPQLPLVTRLINPPALFPQLSCNCGT